MKIQSAFLAVAVAFASAVCACSSSDNGSGSGGSSGNASGGSSNSGGTVASGGVTNTGGAEATGGKAGSENSGGAAGKSGDGGSGGTTTRSGGTSSSGGIDGTGGTTSKASSGGGNGTGGAKGTGGSTGEGGAKGTGGDSSPGGSEGTGGVTGTGGTTAVCGPPSASPTSTPIQINDNGGWNWHLDERGVIDIQGNKMIIGSIASGGSRNGYAEAVIYDLANKKGTRSTLGTGLSNNVDDHNAPAFVVRPDGKYVALWSSHRTDCYSRHSIYSGSSWSKEVLFDWGKLGCPWPGAATNMVTYANPWYMDGTLYVAFRTVDSSPSFLVSPDEGESWTYYGRLTSTKQVGYVAGYYKYWGNNKDRIDFCGTEAHPRDYDTNLWHGYVKGGKVYDSFDKEIDSSLKDANSSTTTSKDISAYTLAFKTGATAGSVALIHLWNLDMVRYDDGTVVILGQGRAKGTCGTEEGYGKTNCDPDKRMVYLRFDGKSWKPTYLVKAGPKLYSTEEDYIGGGCLHPDDPNTIFVSSNFDPRDDTTKTSKRELYQGTTCDNGATWQWTPITKNSTVDNIRPIVPKWDATHTALVWMKGTYSTAQSYQMQIVGLVSEHPAGQVSLK